ncbi:MAG: hypothetical protein ILA25_05685 [Prevotella sp.]|nr:hypothetical protein [Prevotella sp.]
MKKTYQQPVLSVYKIQMQGMLAASVEVGDEYNGSQGVGARGYIFDEEDEE